MINTNSKNVEYYGKIWYEVGKNHLDKKEGIYTYEDIYRFDFNCFYSDDVDEIEAYIKNDLMSVASGGSTKNVLPVVFDIHKI